jgi:hypothetical protein
MNCSRGNSDQYRMSSRARRFKTENVGRQSSIFVSRVAATHARLSESIQSAPQYTYQGVRQLTKPSVIQQTRCDVTSLRSAVGNCEHRTFSRRPHDLCALWILRRHRYHRSAPGAIGRHVTLPNASHPNGRFCEVLNSAHGRAVIMVLLRDFWLRQTNE